MAIVIALLTVATVTCEQLIVTEREKVETLLNELAGHVANNNTDGILPHISGKHPETKQEAMADMAKATFNSCTVIGTNYFEGPTAEKPGAEICFAVSVSGSSGQFVNENGRMKVTINFDKSGDQWKITKYKYELPMGSVKL